MLAAIPAQSGAAKLVPPMGCEQMAEALPHELFPVDVTMAPLAGSASAEKSGWARPGHVAPANTPACHDGRAK